MKKLILILTITVLTLFSGCTSVAVMPEKQITQDFLFEIAKGDIDGAYVVHKFGANDNVGTSIQPVSLSGNYRTPTTAQTLEILSDNAGDTSNGAGARKVKIFGLNSSGEEIQEEVTLNGLTPVTLSNQYLRIYRYYVLESGTYASQTQGSHLGEITIRGVGGGDLWSYIDVIDGGFGAGQSEIGAYTVPKGKTCWLLKKVMSVNSNKYANIYFFKRENITQTTAPFKPMRLVEKHIGVVGVTDLNSRSAIDKFEELTDIGFLANTNTGTAEVSVEFELVCLDNEKFNLN